MDAALDDLAAIPVPRELAHLRRFALDGALLLFDRRSGLTAICDGPETAELRMRAPRAVQFALTNACNLACGFCSRDARTPSTWTVDDAFDLLAGLAERGTMEVAFGGGEPLAFPGLVELVTRLWDETPIGPSLTTNGTLLDDAAVRALAPVTNQIRVSVYDDVDARPAIARLRAAGGAFGVNWLVTPARLPRLETAILDLFALGVRDVLLLSYNGLDPSLHLAPAEHEDLARRVCALARGLGARMRVKLDVCWGDRMASVPTLFPGEACAAGREHVVVTSDRRLAPCSFHHLSLPFDGPDELLALWSREAPVLASAARDPGCARLPGCGLPAAPRHLPVVSP
jgi:hypothetical protein